MPLKASALSAPQFKHLTGHFVKVMRSTKSSTGGGTGTFQKKNVRLSQKTTAFLLIIWSPPCRLSAKKKKLLNLLVLYGARGSLLFALSALHGSHFAVLNSRMLRGSHSNSRFNATVSSRPCRTRVFKICKAELSRVARAAWYKEMHLALRRAS